MSEQISIEEVTKNMNLTWESFNNTEARERKKQWDDFRNMFPEHAEEWEDYEACIESGCNLHSGGWCKHINFPCGYNPFFSPRTGFLGMACMGLAPEEV